jgi:hypothetical protein
MHRPDSMYSFRKAPCPRLQIGYPVIVRLGVAAAGFVVAGIVVAGGSFLRHFGETRAGRSGAAARQR